MKTTLKNNNKHVHKSLKSDTNKFGYTTDNLEKSCFKWKLNALSAYLDPQNVPSHFTLMTMNIWGLSKNQMDKYTHMNKRMHKISNLIKDKSPDIVCLQEMSSSSFSMIDKLISPKYYRSENNFLSNSSMISKRQRTLETFGYFKYRPQKVEVISIGGNISYENSTLVTTYPNLVIFNIYVQAGSNHSPGQKDNASHYSRCRREQFQMIHQHIKKVPKNKKIILCGDFNCHLDGNYNDWTELKQIHAMKLTDTFRTLHPKLHGFTEDTKINSMRWNTKFITKQFRFDGILVKGLKPQQASIIGKKPFLLNQKETQLVLQFLKKQGLQQKHSQIIYADDKKKNLYWWPSDHFGIITKLSF